MNIVFKNLLNDYYSLSMLISTASILQMLILKILFPVTLINYFFCMQTSKSDWLCNILNLLRPPNFLVVLPLISLLSTQEKYAEYHLDHYYMIHFPIFHIVGS